MSFKVKALNSFSKELKRLAKKYPSLKDEFAVLIDSLSQDPFQGDRLIENCFKIRLAIKSKQVGKSGGARIITHVVVVERKVYLLSIYDKSERSSITNKEIQELIKKINP